MTVVGADKDFFYYIDSIKEPNTVQVMKKGNIVGVGGNLNITWAEHMEVEKDGSIKGINKNCVTVDKDGNVTVLHCTYDPDTKSGTPGADARKVKGTIHWLDAKTAVDIPVRQYEYFALPNEETGRNEYNPNSKHDVVAKAESSLKEAKGGERFQFFRNGYYVADTKLSKEGEPVFNQIVGLKSTYRP